jgi:hypothetical protein
MTDLDPAAVMADHKAHRWTCRQPPATPSVVAYLRRPDMGSAHCLPYRLAEALVASETTTARAWDEGWAAGLVHASGAADFGEPAELDNPYDRAERAS